MLHKNHGKSVNSPSLKLKNVRGNYIIMGGALITFSGILIACGNISTHSGNAPVRSDSVYSKNTIGWPAVNVVAADTYRVCDAGGCTDSVTKNKSISEIRANYRDKRSNLKRLEPPLLPANETAMKIQVDSNRIGRYTSSLLKKRKRRNYRALKEKGKSDLNSGTTSVFGAIPGKVKFLKETKFGSKSKRKTRQRPKFSSIIGVRFKYNRHDLSQNEKGKLDILLSRIRKSKGIYIAGYMDNTSQLSRSDQKLLASKRAIAIARHFKIRGIKVSKLKVGAYGKCCFGSLNDLKGIKHYFRRAEVYFSRKSLLRDARLKRQRKLVTNRRVNVNRIWN